jgi:hypothetical protein
MITEHVENIPQPEWEAMDLWAKLFHLGLTNEDLALLEHMGIAI